MSNKHAYMIIAHDKFEQLFFLLNQLDDSRNDLFIHISKSIDDSLFKKIKTRIRETVCKSQVYFSNRIEVNWGDYSQIEAEYALFEAVKKSNDTYSYCHLLSGSDLPLVSQNKIHSFFEKNPDKIFLTMVSDEIFKKNKIEERVKFHYLAPHLSERTLKSKVFGYGIRYFRKIELALNRLLKIDHLKEDSKYLGYASNWCSFDYATIDLLLSEKDYVEKIFSKSILCDELFIPTVLNKNNMLDKIYYIKPTQDLPNEFQGNLRYINWWDGTPYTWTSSNKDIEQLRKGIQLGHFFSRKFDLELYPEMKEIIETFIRENRE